jgi:hypothetical protein
VNKTYLGAAEMINEQINNNFDDPDGVRDANKKGAGLPAIPVMNINACSKNITFLYFRKDYM